MHCPKCKNYNIETITAGFLCENPDCPVDLFSIIPDENYSSNKIMHTIILRYNN